MTIVDWIIVGVIVFYALLGVRRGFVATIVYSVGALASLAASVYAASRLCTPVSRLFLPITNSIAVGAVPYASEITQTWNNLSDYLQGVLSKAGITPDILQQEADPGQALQDAVSNSLAQCIAFFLLLIGIYIVLRIALGWLVRVLNLITHLPILHSCNALLGGALGAATGLVLCTCVLWALKLFAPAVYSDVGMLPPSVMQRSAIAGTLVGWNDGVSLFEPEVIGS